MPERTFQALPKGPSPLEVPRYRSRPMTPRATQTASLEKAPEHLPYEPAPAFRASSLQDDTPFASNQGKRIGILIVAYNAVTTLTKVLKRITPNVWKTSKRSRFSTMPARTPPTNWPSASKRCAASQAPRTLAHPKPWLRWQPKGRLSLFHGKRFDAVVLLHGDGQYAPEILRISITRSWRAKRTRSSDPA